MNNKGFTLIEIMIALAIAAVAIITLYKLHIQNVNAATDHSFDVVAPMLASHKLNSIENDLKNQKGNFENEFSGYSYTVNVEKKDLEDFTQTRVDITIYYGNNGFSLRRYFFSYGK